MAKQLRKQSRTGSRASSRAGSEGVLQSVWRLIEENPQLALALAMELGALVSEVTRPRGNVKKLLLRQLQKGAAILPQLVAAQSAGATRASKFSDAAIETVMASGVHAPRTKKPRRNAR